MHEALEKFKLSPFTCSPHLITIELPLFIVSFWFSYNEKKSNNKVRAETIIKIYHMAEAISFCNETTL